MNKLRILAATALAGVLLIVGGCQIRFQLNQASIHADARTVSIPMFPNISALVNPTLSATFTDALQQRFANQTKLMLIDEEGDLAFTGEIVNYVSTPTSVTSAEAFSAAMQRLTITVRVTFVNRLDPQWNFENRTFSQYADYPSDQQFQQAEQSLVPEIVDALVTDIFNAAVANW